MGGEEIGVRAGKRPGTGMWLYRLFVEDVRSKIRPGGVGAALLQPPFSKSLLTFPFSSRAPRLMLSAPLLDTMSAATPSAAKVVPTPVGDIKKIVAETRAVFDQGRTRSIDWRVRQIKQMKKLVEENKDKICAALHADLRRPTLEGVIMEVRRLAAFSRCAFPDLS